MEATMTQGHDRTRQTDGRREVRPGPYQLSCPTCGSRCTRRIGYLFRAVKRWEDYECAACGEQYRLKYSLVGREVLP